MALERNCSGEWRGEVTHKGEAFVGMKSKGSQLRRQNMMLSSKMVEGVISSQAVA